MIDVKKAAEVAAAYLSKLYSSAVDLETVRLEEVELAEDERFWLITLSFVEQDSTSIWSPRPAKQYKVFKIDAETGEVRSMKIRQLEGA